MKLINAHLILTKAKMTITINHL